METNRQAVKNELESLICRHVQTVMMSLAGSLYRISPSSSGGLPVFQVVARAVALPEDWGVIDLLVADRKHRTFALTICPDAIDPHATVTAVRAAGLLRLNLLASLTNRLTTLQQAAEGRADVEKLLAKIEEVMPERWKAVQVLPVLVGSDLTPEALDFVRGFNALGEINSLDSQPGPVLVGTYQSAAHPGSTGHDFLVRNALPEPFESAALPPGPGTAVWQSHADRICDMFVRDFANYEQQKKAHRSGMFKAFRENS